MAFAPTHFFDGLRYAGRVGAARAKYHVYDGGTRFLLLTENRTRENNFYLSAVDAAYVDKVRKRFRGRDVTTVEIRKRLGSRGFRPLQALLVLVALDKATIRRRGKPIVFHVTA